jgi:hypothetical protein
MAYYDRGTPIQSDFNAWQVSWGGADPSKHNIFKWEDGNKKLHHETWSEFQNGVAPYEKKSVFGDPKVVSWNSAVPDANLKKTSPLIGAGKSGQCPAVDFELAPRTSSSCDIGALSFSESGAATTATTTTTTITTTTTTKSTTPPSSTPAVVVSGVADVTTTWSTVSFGQELQSPIVVASPLSSNDPDGAILRMRGVKSGSVEMRIEEFSHLDGVHQLEKVDWLVVPRGVHSIGAQGEGKLFAGSAVCLDIPTVVTIPSGVFSKNPVVTASVVSFLDKAVPLLRIWAITPTSFKCQVRGEQGAHDAERVHFFAVTAGVWSLGGTRVLEASRALVNADWTVLKYVSTDLMTRPRSVATMQSRLGTDPCHLRVQEKYNKRFSARIETPSKVSHVQESIAWIVVGNGGSETLKQARSASNNNNLSTNDNNGLSQSGVIAIAVVGAALAATIVIVSIVLVRRRKRQMPAASPLLENAY